jgi:predicted adenylyl cyclase CyaB
MSTQPVPTPTKNGAGLTTVEVPDVDDSPGLIARVKNRIQENKKALDDAAGLPVVEVTPSSEVVSSISPPEEVRVEVPITPVVPPTPVTPPPGASEPVSQDMVEVEMKFRLPTRKATTGDDIANKDDFRDTLRDFPCYPSPHRVSRVRETDTYFTSPFLAADAYVRIRVEEQESNPGGGPVLVRADLTWKGPKLNSQSKSRPEEVLSVQGVTVQETKGRVLAAGRLLRGLGFTPFATVMKDRETWQLTYAGVTVNVCIDAVHDLGDFVELEVVTIAPAAAGMVPILQSVAQSLELGEQETRGYAELVKLKGAGGPGMIPATRVVPTPKKGRGKK